MVMYDNEIETKGNKIETKDKIKLQHIRNHDFSDVITPSPFYLVAKPFLWGIGRTIRNDMRGGGGGGGEFSSRRNFFSLSNSLYEFFFNRCA